MVKMLKVMVLEDERSCLELIRRTLSKRFPDSDIVAERNPYHIFCTAAIHRPDILVVDYRFLDFCLTDERRLMKRLFKFKGLVLIYSSHDHKHILEGINKYGPLPENFRILPKSDPKRLIDEITRYQEN